ncbi:sarcosine oxidase subunit alpha family protein [Jannaschia sp. W003]|uniref:sarcosine oxidase subunit alpha family protein n=1 Tax=Jannaschia sp. W003 TaxID=2867012 RepID=UPI0021A8C4E6|nr:sarcosine oxidase subunit alpha family protein [Jannaschia sp. W003]UWQ21496.1 sarcosine oxidase subunit alpha family protein [Jannaschia sp. W003]
MTAPPEPPRRGPDRSDPARRQPNRLAGGRIDRARPLRFSFDGTSYGGFAGDTLASALLANGVRLMGRSFKYHRPRGPLTASSAEPNALVTLGRGAHADPNARATTAELFDGLEARSQNRWPSLAFDLMAVNDLFAPLLGAGFYYKTFMWPRPFWERVYEPLIRRAAGLGRLSGKPDPSLYDRGWLHCDLLVIGAGPAGLMAALTAARAGASTILLDEDSEMGGALLHETRSVENGAAMDWAAGALAELASLPNVRLMPRTAAVGTFDGGLHAALERCGDHVARLPEGKPRQILWRIRAARALLCAGATERPLAFENNDRPGIMTASALRAYAVRWAAAPARRVAFFTTNDDGHRAAQDLHEAGVRVAAVVDVREDAPRSRDFEVIRGARVMETDGRRGLSFIHVRQSDGTLRPIECGALGVAGGWNPNLHLATVGRARPVWDEHIAAFVPGGALPPGLAAAGAAAGVFSTHGALSTGTRAAAQALGDMGRDARPLPIPRAEDAPVRQSAFFFVEGCQRGFLDQQNDVTVKDVEIAWREGFQAAEHLKRYTTLGMATDAGKTSNVGGLAVMAALTGRSIPEIGTTTVRPPYLPVAIGAFAGRGVGAGLRPTRRTPTHGWAEARGAAFQESGLWLRAAWFPEAGETHWRESVDREARAVREAVGLCDCSTLGKIEVLGPDAARFLDRLYANRMGTLKEGRCRYGLMLREDGVVMDDGTVARLGPEHFVVTTTTANAGPVYAHMEFAHQGLFPDMDVTLVPATDGWAQIAVAGPRSRELLQRITDADLAPEAFPFMGCAEADICGIPGRLFRISFSGELAWEVAVPARYGEALMERLMAEGSDLGATPYGVEALNVLRIEKGHATGAELDGTTTAAMLGLGRMVAAKEPDAIGAAMARRGIHADAAAGPRLVGLLPVDPEQPVPAGAHLFNETGPVDADHARGHVTSACHSPALGRPIALALLHNGADRIGERMRAVSPVDGDAEIEVEVVHPCFVDPEGERLRA